MRQHGGGPLRFDSKPRYLKQLHNPRGLLDVSESRESYTAVQRHLYYDVSSNKIIKPSVLTT